MWQTLYAGLPLNEENPKKMSEGYNVLSLSSSCCDLYNYQSFSIPTPVVKLLSWQDTVTASTHSSQLLPVQKAAADFHRPQLLESRTMDFQMYCSQTIGVCLCYLLAKMLTTGQFYRGTHVQVLKFFEINT